MAINDENGIFGVSRNGQNDQNDIFDVSRNGQNDQYFEYLQYMINQY